MTLNGAAQAEAVKVGLAVLLVGIAFYIAKKKFGTVANAAAGVTGAVGDVATGVVLGVGDTLGVPRTDETECEKALREGRTWDASFACPASKYIGSFFD